jgi:hypothetical protein
MNSSNTERGVHRDTGLRLHTPMPPEIDPDAPMPTVDPPPVPADDPPAEPPAPDGDPPVRPPPVSAAGRRAPWRASGKERIYGTR